MKENLFATKWNFRCTFVVFVCSISSIDSSALYVLKNFGRSFDYYFTVLLFFINLPGACLFKHIESELLIYYFNNKNSDG